MHSGIESIWFLCTVSPVVVLSIRTRAARHKARKCEKAWKIAERYIV
jgi:hypothetical protein